MRRTGQKPLWLLPQSEPDVCMSAQIAHGRTDLASPHPPHHRNHRTSWRSCAANHVPPSSHCRDRRAPGVVPNHGAGWRATSRLLLAGPEPRRSKIDNGLRIKPIPDELYRFGQAGSPCHRGPATASDKANHGMRQRCAPGGRLGVDRLDRGSGKGSQNLRRHAAERSAPARHMFPRYVSRQH